MLNLAELNALNHQEFTARVAPVFEHSPWIAERTWAARPFHDRTHLFNALRQTVTSSSADEKLALIRAHPDLVGSATLTDESRSEQAAAGLGNLSPEEISEFRRSNAEYRQRFGFPFVICARENKKEAILTAFPKRLANSREAEIETALNEIFQIAELRLRDLVE